MVAAKAIAAAKEKFKGRTETPEAKAADVTKELEEARKRRENQRAQQRAEQDKKDEARRMEEQAREDAKSPEQKAREKAEREAKKAEEIKKAQEEEEANLARQKEAAIIYRARKKEAAERMKMVAAKALAKANARQELIAAAKARRLAEFEGTAETAEASTTEQNMLQPDETNQSWDDGNSSPYVDPGSKTRSPTRASLGTGASKLSTMVEPPSSSVKSGWSDRFNDAPTVDSHPRPAKSGQMPRAHRRSASAGKAGGVKSPRSKKPSRLKASRLTAIPKSKPVAVRRRSSASTSLSKVVVGSTRIGSPTLGSVEPPPGSIPEGDEMEEEDDVPTNTFRADSLLASHIRNRATVTEEQTQLTAEDLARATKQAAWDAELHHELQLQQAISFAPASALTMNEEEGERNAPTTATTLPPTAFTVSEEERRGEVDFVFMRAHALSTDAGVQLKVATQLAVIAAQSAHASGLQGGRENGTAPMPSTGQFLKEGGLDIIDSLMGSKDASVRNGAATALSRLSLNVHDAGLEACSTEELESAIRTLIGLSSAPHPPMQEAALASLAALAEDDWAERWIAENGGLQAVLLACDPGASLGTRVQGIRCLRNLSFNADTICDLRAMRGAVATVEAMALCGVEELVVRAEQVLENMQCQASIDEGNNVAIPSNASPVTLAGMPETTTRIPATPAMSDGAPRVPSKPNSEEQQQQSSMQVTARSRTPLLPPKPNAMLNEAGNGTSGAVADATAAVEAAFTAAAAAQQQSSMQVTARSRTPLLPPNGGPGLHTAATLLSSYKYGTTPQTRSPTMSTPVRKPLVPPKPKGGSGGGGGGGGPKAPRRSPPMVPAKPGTTTAEGLREEDEGSGGVLDEADTPGRNILLI